jgi:hypothetical protein
MGGLAGIHRVALFAILALNNAKFIRFLRARALAVCLLLVIGSFPGGFAANRTPGLCDW